MTAGRRSSLCGLVLSGILPEATLWAIISRLMSGHNHPAQRLLIADCDRNTSNLRHNAVDLMHAI
jgi:hypothetical protein